MRATLLLLLLLPAPQDPAAELLKDVREIGSPGSPGSLSVWGEDAFVAVAGKRGKLAVPVVAAGTLEKGRVVAFSHDGYLAKAAADEADTGKLLENALAWTGRKVSLRVGVLGHEPAARLKARALTRAGWVSELADLDVLILSRASLSDAEIEAVSKFVRGGGGLLAALTGWGWLQGAGDKPMTSNSLNRLLAPAGIGWTDGFAERTGKAGFAVASVPPLVHGLRAFEALVDLTKRKNDAELLQASDAAMDAFRLLPKDDTKMRPRLEALLAERGAALVPTAKAPLGRPLDRFLLACQLESIRDLPASRVKAHPAAAEFPGAVPADAPAVSRAITIDLAVPGWHSTGLYSPPGKVVTVAAPAGTNLTLRIGAHSDRLWHHARWSRVPDIARSVPLRGEKTEAASPFGGLVYIEVPSNAKPGAPSLTISGAVEAPFYERGKTDAAEWKLIRARPGPWAELATRKVILTVPSSEIRALDDPGPLMELWDRILDAAADLAAIPHDRRRPERYVSDVQISAGYMHSGYPIMTHLDAASAMAGLEKMTKGQWGLVHELGHNHQQGDWTFEGTGEVTNNLFSLYLLETVCGVKGGDGHDDLRNPGRRIAAYLGRGARFADWKDDPFLALQTYVQLKDAFGWDAFKKVFAEYRDLPREKRPKNDDEKRDQWMVRFSRTAGKNLGPFFVAWGIPTSAAARDSIKDLPGWMPEGFPPKQP